jgi:hypothetical protein
VVEASKEMFSGTVAPWFAEPDATDSVTSCPWQVAMPTSARTKTRLAWAEDSLRSRRNPLVWGTVVRLIKDRI